jgi:hypothetical protein
VVVELDVDARTRAAARDAGIGGGSRASRAAAGSRCANSGAGGTPRG